MPFLLSVKILHSSHSNVFSWRTYAFLDNTSLFYSCSFIDAVFADLRYALTFLLGMSRYPMRLWTVTGGKLSVDIHLACACICVYVHAYLRYALTFLLGMYRNPMRLWTVTAGTLSVDIHLACACLCVYVHADLSDAKLLQDY